MLLQQRPKPGIGPERVPHRIQPQLPGGVEWRTHCNAQSIDGRFGLTAHKVDLGQAPLEVQAELRTAKLEPLEVQAELGAAPLEVGDHVDCLARSPETCVCPGEPYVVLDIAR